MSCLRVNYVLILKSQRSTVFIIPKRSEGDLLRNNTNEWQDDVPKSKIF